MRLLLDTNALLYHSSNSNRLSEEAYRLIDHPETQVYVSIVTPAELACLARRGRFSGDLPWNDWFRKVITQNQWQCLDITWDIIDEAFSLPDPMHHDPADRIIVATGRRHGLTLVTSDRRLLESSLLPCLS
ncbi:MAG: PilT protein [Verrucomicrobiales bacterium]|jgi:PIN domain nuclease of toxin-antitoxin system|nr:PilT protein [Verrucomicrobiales bacterium]